MKVILTAEKIQERVKEMAAEIDKFYDGRPYTVMGLLNGACYFAVDLTRCLKGDFILDSILVSSYVGENSTGKITMRGTPKKSVTGRNVLIVDEVLDSGLTLSTLKRHFLEQGAESVNTVVLVQKDRPLHPLAQDFKAEWVGFRMGDRFLVGCGMDYNEKYRQLDCIAEMEECDLK
ncbi:MAG: hypoxanthine phosphoribosyltransferase [Lentisphaeria bacterium]|nr:hypoxanthine phosphoribosyltransferase [Lentisphaeria bacterium]